MKLFFLLLFIFLSHLQCKTINSDLKDDTIEEIDFRKESGLYKYKEGQNGLQAYKINMNGCTDCYYLHFKVTSELDNMYLYFSSNDTTFKEGRELLAHEAVAPVEMCVKQEQWTGESKDFYIGVECPNDEPCSYIIQAQNENKCTFPYMKKYSYYVATEDIQKISIFIDDSNNLIKNKKIKDDENSFITLWVRSFSDAATVELKDISQYTIEQNKINEITIFNIYKNDDLNGITVHIDTEIGDLITIGSSVFSNGKYLDSLYPNDPQITAYINQETNSYVCVPVGFNENMSYESNDVFDVTFYFYNGIGEIYIKNNQEEEIIRKVINYYTHTESVTFKELEHSSVCVKIPDGIYNDTSILFDLRIIDTKNLITKKGDSEYNVAQIELRDPQYNNFFYRRSMYSGNINIFQTFKPNLDSTDVYFSMKLRSGDCEMFIDKCLTYPKCNYDSTDFLTRPNKLGDIFYWKIRSNEIIYTNPIGPTQYFSIVKCYNNPNHLYSYFEMVFFNNIEHLFIKENEIYKQFLVKEQVNQYKILKNQLLDVNQLIIEIQIISGDITLIFDTEINIQKTHSASKLFYLITLESIINNDLIINVKGLKNSIYSIKYNTLPRIHNANIQSNFYSLITLNKDNNDQLFYYNNSRIGNDSPFLINFYSLNCELDIYYQLNDKSFSKLPNIDYYYSQDIITDSEERYTNDQYVYKVSIKKEENINMNNKVCMFYTSAIEYESHEDANNLRNYLVLIENIPIQIIFSEKYDNIQLLYTHVNITDSFIIDFNLLNKAEYNINLYFNNIKSDQQYTIKNNKYLYLTSNDWKNYCMNPSQPCNVIIDILLSPNYKDEQMMQILVKQPSETPSYIQKNKSNKVFSNGDKWMFYFTEIGQNDKAEISIKNEMSNGLIYARIAEKNQEEPDQNPDWMSLYEFPKKEEDSLKYNDLFHKIIVTSDDTKNCLEGCYILISIKNINDNEEYNDEKYGYLFDLTVEIKNEDNIQITSITMNEYIIGNIKYDQNENNNIKVFYKVLIPEDSDYLIIDWQNEQSNLYINIGDELPTLTNYDFIFESKGKDTLLKLSKESILEKAKDKPYTDSIKYIKLIIGIWGKQPETFYQNYYSLNVYLENEEKENILNIHIIKEKQQVLCNTKKIDDSDLYRCLYALIYLDTKIDYDSMLYVLLNEEYDIHAEFIDKELIENLEYEKLKELIPDEKSTYSTSKTGEKYLYIPKGIENKYLFISIITKKENTVTLLNSLYSNDDNILKPNPTLTELLNTKKESLSIDINNDYGLTINLKSIKGNAEISFENSSNKKYYLNETNSNLALISEKNDKIIIKKLNEDNLSFYVSYGLNLDNYNIEKLNIDEHNKYIFKNSDFPVYYYSRLNNKDNDILVSINLYDLGIKNDELGNDFNNIFNILGYVLSEDELIQIKNDPEKGLPQDKTKAIIGIFDSSLLVGNIYIFKNQLINIDNPYIFTIIEKNENYKEKITFNQINAESNINEIKEENIIYENIYNYGKLSLDNEIINNELIISPKNKYIRIIYASNSQYLNWCINIEKNIKTNYTFDEFDSLYQNGKSIIIFKIPENIRKIYLNIFHNESKSTNIQLNNYVINYISSINKMTFNDYSIINNDPEIKIYSLNSNLKNENNKYKIVFNPIDLQIDNSIKISYIIKIVPNDTYIEGEYNNTIALTESPCNVLQIDNPSKTSEGKIEVEVKDIPDKYEYINIIAKINDKSNIDFISYDPKGSEITPGPEPKPPEGNGELNKTLIIIVLAVFGFGVLVIIIWFMVNRCKRGRRAIILKHDVEEISFKKSERKSGYLG